MQWPQCATPPFMNHATPCNTLLYPAILCYTLQYLAIPPSVHLLHSCCFFPGHSQMITAAIFTTLTFHSLLSRRCFSSFYNVFQDHQTHFSSGSFYSLCSAFQMIPGSLQPFSQCLPLFPINWQWRPLSICRYHYFSNDSYRVLRFMSSSSSSSSEKQDNLSTRSQHSLVRFSEIGMTNLWVGEPD